jgi:hypothetical protein
MDGDMSQSLRFVVLHHTGVDEPHYDFMFETSPTSQLVTFRLPQWPVFENQRALKLRDHRRAYLDFQGDISMGRGNVQRVDEGDAQVTGDSRGWTVRIENRFQLRFDPQTAGQEENWLVAIHPPPDSNGSPQDE